MVKIGEPWFSPGVQIALGTFQRGEMPVNIFVHRTNLMGGAPGESTWLDHGGSMVSTNGNPIWGYPICSQTCQFLSIKPIMFYEFLSCSLFISVFWLQFLGLVVLNLKVLSNLAQAFRWTCSRVDELAFCRASRLLGGVGFG